MGFTQYAARHSPEQVVKVLNEVFFRFDNLAQEHGVEKIKTIGDAYMGVSGVPLSFPDHAVRAARMALSMVDAIRDMNSEGICDFRIRIGLHAGPAVAGVIGKHKFSYDVWGDTVNIAKRYESASEPGRIHLSSAVAGALPAAFEIESRGQTTIKDVGTVESFFLNRLRSAS
ncbi:MAG: adenylate/guanylate cyclase domain-containing protein [bacterium]|nr:adenylate/guanylate cyclase domain-containing protein [bacterium]